MARTTYSAQFKAKLVLELMSGEKELGAIAHENGIDPNMLRGWKREFLDKASTVLILSISVDTFHARILAAKRRVPIDPCNTFLS